MFVYKIFYTVKPLIPRKLQIAMRRLLVCGQKFHYRDIWPIDEKAGQLPAGGCGWPDQKQFGLILTHDVDTPEGQEKCYRLIELEKKLGFRSSFNFVPERYDVSPALRNYLTANGFEVGVHGLNHDGKLYNSKKIFKSRAVRINRYLKQWGSVGFRSPAMHHNLDWTHDLDIEYDASTFDTDPFEPQSDGVNTICPFWVEDAGRRGGFVELPYTLAQDHLLFVILGEKNIEIWKRKLDWIIQQRGMALINTHPDYMNFTGGKLGIEEYPARYYEDFLTYVKANYKGNYWHVLPRQAARFWSDSARN